MYEIGIEFWNKLSYVGTRLDVEECGRKLNSDTDRYVHRHDDIVEESFILIMYIRCKINLQDVLNMISNNFIS